MQAENMELNRFSFPSPSSASNTSHDLNLSDLTIIEEGPQILQDTNSMSSNLGEDVSSRMTHDINMTNLQILEEGPRVCPICEHEIKAYYISFDDQIEMCENINCDYPFAYEDNIKIIREENGVQIVDTISLQSKKPRSTTSVTTQASRSAWSCLEKLCNISEPNSPGLAAPDRIKTRDPSVKTEAQRKKEELLENVEKIKQMTRSMNENSRKSRGIIRNEKWIQNLRYLQGMSGVNLLKPEEIKTIKKKECQQVPSELTIDIDKNNLSNIKIEVNHKLTAPKQYITKHNHDQT